MSLWFCVKQAAPNKLPQCVVLVLCWIVLVLWLSLCRRWCNFPVEIHSGGGKWLQEVAVMCNNMTSTNQSTTEEDVNGSRSLGRVWTLWWKRGWWESSPIFEILPAAKVKRCSLQSVEVCSKCVLHVCQGHFPTSGLLLSVCVSLLAKLVSYR